MWACLGRLGLALVACLMVPLLGTSAWAHHTPAPYPTDGRGYVASGWGCHETQPPAALDGSRANTNSCAVTGWQPLPAAPTPLPHPTNLPVTVTNPQPLPVAVQGTVPVAEVSPVAPDTVNLECGTPTASDSSSPSAAPSPSPAPSGQPGEESSSPAGCAVTASLASPQYVALTLILGVLLLIAVTRFLLSESRPWRG